MSIIMEREYFRLMMKVKVKLNLKLYMLCRSSLLTVPDP